MAEVHVAQLLKAPVGTQRTVEFSDRPSDIPGILGLRKPLVGRVRLVRTSHGILAQCSYEAELVRECGRCLEIVGHRLSGEFSQEFLPTVNVYTGLPEALVVDPDEQRIRPDHILDVGEAIRQDIVIRQPMQPLCRPDCAGLCPTCGQDLNQMNCRCDSSEVEGLGRLGELLKEKLSRGA